MIGLGSILGWQFPNAPDFGYAVVPSQNGFGQLGSWDVALMGRTAPTQAEITSWTLPAAKYYQRRTITRQADTAYEAINAIDGDTISMFKDELLMDIVANKLAPVANPLTDPQKVRRDQMASIRQNHRAKMTTINAATTVAAVEAVTWP